MKKYLLTALLAGFFNYSMIAADGYNILTNIEDANQKSVAEKALNDANLDKYRLLDARTILIFEDGTQVELLSVQECKARNISVDESATRQGAPIYKGGKLYFHESGIIIEKRTPRENKN